MKIRNDVVKQLRTIRRKIEKESNPAKKLKMVREYEVLLDLM